MVNTKTLLALALPIAAFTITMTAANEAHARRGAMIINTGEDVMQIADLPPDVVSELHAAGIDGTPQIGVMYSRFGVFWLDIVRWNPQYVLYTDQGMMEGFEYETGTPAELAALAGLDESAIEKPMRYYAPPGGVILGLLLVIGGPIYAYKQFASGRQA